MKQHRLTAIDSRVEGETEEVVIAIEIANSRAKILEMEQAPRLPVRQLARARVSAGDCLSLVLPVRNPVSGRILLRMHPKTLRKRGRTLTDLLLREILIKIFLKRLSWAQQEISMKKIA